MKCGKPKDPETSTMSACNCLPEQPPAMTGWRCPNCGAGNSPFTTTCPHCAPPKQYTITV